MEMESNDSDSVEMILCRFEQTYPEYQAAIRVYGNAPIIVFGLIANSLNIIVFRHGTMRTSTVNWFLFALALSDQTLLICNFFMLSLPVISEKIGNRILMEISAYLTRFTYPLAQTSQTSSVYLTVTVSLYRYLGVCHPFRAQRWISNQRVKVSIAITLFLSALFNISRWLEVTIVSCYSPIFNANSLLMIPTQLLSDSNYMQMYFVYGYTVVMFVLPFSILITTNVLIIQAVHKSRSVRQRMMNLNRPKKDSRKLAAKQRNQSNAKISKDSLDGTESGVDKGYQCATTDSRRQSEAKESSQELNTTCMLVAIVALFLVCNSLAFINNIVYVEQLHQEVQWTSEATFTVMVEVANTLVTLNSATNIVIYVLFSSKYRQILAKLCSFSIGDEQRIKDGRGNTVRRQSERRPVVQAYSILCSSSSKQCPSTRLSYSDTKLPPAISEEAACV